ncbi:MAG: hypothetical protein K6U88_10075, partial [Dehalococcoidia bacterium]|nr:hypothetical protein [Dehalococcoidia bacterium]
MKIILIAVVVLAVLATGFIVAAGPEPHIVIPGEVVWKVGFMPITSTLMASWLAIGQAGASALVQVSHRRQSVQCHRAVV